MRRLPTWCQPRTSLPRPRITWFRDMAASARTGFGLRNRRPGSAPAGSTTARERLGVSDLTRVPDLLDPLTWRIDYQVVGLERLRGIQPPVVLAVNEAGSLDWQVLRAILPAGFRTTTRRPSRALSKGRSVVIFTADPATRGGVGEFSDVAAELANQHNVPIVPVGILGTFRLKEVLKLSLRTRPRVTVRFGAPVYVRGRALADSTAEIQATVAHLARSSQASWWEAQRMDDTPPPVEVLPRWQRLWHQSAPTTRPQPARIWSR